MLLLLMAVPLVTDAQRPAPLPEGSHTTPQQPVVAPPSEGSQATPARGGAPKAVRREPDRPSFPSEAWRDKEKYVPNQVLVRFRRGTPKSWMDIAHGVVRAKVLQDFQYVDGLFLVQLPADETVEDAIKGYRNQPEVLYAQPNFIYHATIDPNDPSYQDGTQWAMRNTGQNGGTNDADIDAPEAWDITTGSSNVVVMVIDTGYDYLHPDLAANTVNLESNCNDGLDNDGNGHADDCKGFDFVNNDNNPIDDNNHGTHVSGTIGAVGNNGTGVVGVNWNVKIMGCKFLAASGSGSTGNAINCLNYLIATKNAHPELQFVGSNNSWGGRGFDQALVDAIEVQRNNGLLFIAAAGNENADNDWIPSFPSNAFQPNVIAVAATDRNDQLASFSNYGKQNVHLGAPGVAIISTTCTPSGGNCTHTFSIFNGTSMATPHVAGVAALLKAADGTRDWKKIKNLILSGGDPAGALANTTATGRRLNARNSLTCSNRTVDAREQPVLDVVNGQVGVPILLAMLHINCDSPAAGNPVVTVTPTNGVSSVTLFDNGAANVDEESNDGVFSATFTPASATNTLLTFPNGDTVTVFFPTNPTTNYNAPTQPAFNYRNPTGAAKNLSFDDDTRAVIESPFPIAFGGGSFQLLNVGNNGHITFNTSFGGSAFDNLSLPTATPATIVAPWWDDLFSYGDDTGPIGSIQNVRYEVQGSAPNRELILEWKNVEHFDCPVLQIITFETVFFENSSNVLFQYADTDFGSCSAVPNPNNGGSATVGVQVSPSLARQFSMNTASLNNNMALLFVGPVTNNPVPSLSSLVPNNINAGGPQFTLTVNGSNFVGSSIVRWNGGNRTTTFVNGNQLTATIPASDIAAVLPVNVTVFNPAPGGGTSNSLPFTVNNPIPAITSLSPDAIPATSPDFTLTVNGVRFVNSSVVRVNGVNKTTAFVNSTKLTAMIPAADVATVGIRQVTVFNPAPGGGLSNTATLTVNIRNPLPTITSLSPAGSLATGGGLTLDVLGSNYVFNSTVQWNGLNRTTTFINPGRLQAALMAGDLSSPGTGMVTVVSPTPGGGTSNTASFPISAANPVPATTSLSQTMVTAGTVRDKLTFDVNGSNFVNGQSVVRWNGSKRTTTFVNANTLTVMVPSSDVAVAGTAMVTVFTPVPGGGTSNAQTFTINNPPPGISSLIPNNTASGGPQFVLTVIGSNFVPGTVVRWNGAPRPTTFIGANQLRATIPASDIVSPGAVNITVVSPTPGGGPSNILGFTVN